MSQSSFPRILALGSSLPPLRHSQEEIFTRFLEPHLGRNRRARAIFGTTGVKFRNTVVDGSYYSEVRTTQARNDRYLEEAVPLGASAVCRCLEAAHVSPTAVDDLTVVSCTGLDIPGLDLRIAGHLGMRSDLRRTCVLGMGCYGAFPGLQRARDSVAADPHRLALVVAVELCSLHFQLDDSTENIVASALFSDGAAAALVGDLQGRALSPRPPGCPCPLPGPALVDSATFCDYQTFDHMAFHVTDHGFQMRLSAYVPHVLAARVEEYVDTLLERNHLTREQVRFWGIHPGSRKILDYLAARLGLSRDQVAFSRTVLREYGNMSSATIFFVLQEIQQRGSPQPGDYGLLMAFGPGLTMESSLIRW